MKSTKRWQTLLLTGIALVSIPLTLTYTDFAISNQAAPEVQEELVNVPRVTVREVHTGAYHSIISAYGEVNPAEQVNLSSQISGRVIWRSPEFADGNQVNKEQVLLKLDASDYKAALANARQALAEAKLALQQEKRQKQQAEKDWQRSGLKQKPSALVLRIPQLEVAQSRYQASVAAVAQAKRDLAQTEIKAPFAGVISNRDVALGSYIEPGTALALIRGSQKAEITLPLSAKQWQLLPETTAEISLHSREQAGVSWPAKIDRIAANLNTDTRLRSVVLAVDQPLQQETPLLFGSFVTAQIQGKKFDNMFALPASALTADGYIWLVENNHLKRHKAKPLFSRDGQLFINQNSLPASIQLVNKPMSSYLPGTLVQSKQAILKPVGVEQ